MAYAGYMKNTKPEPIVEQRRKVLYADDDHDDKAWVVEACKALDCSLEIEFVENGRQALDYLSHLAQNDMPDLIVLDLNMPELDGRQTLQRLKSNSNYKDIPVIIVTTSSSKVDIEFCKRLGASLYLVKPDTHSAWLKIVEQFVQYVS